MPLVAVVTELSDMFALLPMLLRARRQSSSFSRFRKFETVFVSQGFN